MSSAKHVAQEILRVLRGFPGDFYCRLRERVFPEWGGPFFIRLRFSLSVRGKLCNLWHDRGQSRGRTWFLSCYSYDVYSCLSGPIHPDSKRLMVSLQGCSFLVGRGCYSVRQVHIHMLSSRDILFMLSSCDRFHLSLCHTAM